MAKNNFNEYSTNDWQIPNYKEYVIKPKKFKYALVIPVLNEGERIRKQVIKLNSLNLKVDIIIADGNSIDNALTIPFLKRYNVRALLIKDDEGRLGSQLRIAYSWCLLKNYYGIITVDGNGKDGVEAVVEMIRQLEMGSDYVQGSRYMDGGIAKNTPFLRTLSNRMFHAPLMSVTGRYYFSDTTNGFRAYSKKYLMDSRLKPFRSLFTDYELLFYLTVRAKQIGMRVCQIPVERIYPKDKEVPTKISGIAGMYRIFKQTILAAVGYYNP